MQALNKEERKKAYNNFLIFYIITTLVIITGVFFGMRVPVKQNALMQSQIMQYEREQLFADNYASKVNDIESLLDTVNQPTVQSNLIDAQLDQKLAQLTAMVASDSTSLKPFLTKNIQMLYDMKDDKAMLRASQGTASTSAEKDKIIAELKSKIGEYSSELNNCRTQLIQLSR